MDVRVCSQDDTSIYFVLATDQKIEECAFIPGILAFVPTLKRFKFSPFPCPLPRFYYSTHRYFGEFQTDDDQGKII